MPALRKYEISHPWLTFTLDLRNVSPRLWIALGEAQSKCQHMAGVPLQPDTAAELHQIYLARGLLATAAIEGNTLTEKEVRDLLDKKLKLPPSRKYLAQEIDNVLAGFEGILNDVKAGRFVPLSTQLIKTFNAQVLNKLSLGPEVLPGDIRKHSVGVGTYRGAPAEDCDYLLDRLCEWLNNIHPPEGEEIIYGLIKSVVGHVYLAWIHAFGDGNGRTARLIEAKFLLEAGVPSAAAHLLSNHYNLTRTEYYRQLDQTSKSNGDLRMFMEYAVRGFVDQLREQIGTIQEQQLMVSWVNYVHEKFGSQRTPADRRQRDVVLAMSKKAGTYIKPADIKQLDPQIAAQYATKTPKTVTRDMNRLKKLGLVEAGAIGYRARIEIMRAFLPTSLLNRPRPPTPPSAEVEEPDGQLELGLTVPKG
jgi:Fic family protein